MCDGRMDRKDPGRLSPVNSPGTYSLEGEIIDQDTQKDMSSRQQWLPRGHLAEKSKANNVMKPEKGQLQRRRDAFT